MPDPRDQVELTAIPRLYGPESGAGSSAPSGARPWLSLYFRCSNSYARAYRNSAGTGYHGRCPKCRQSIRFMVGPGGTAQRMFEDSC